MNFLRTAYFKKITAAFFLLLFFCTHIVKALHTHEIASTVLNTSTEKNTASVKAAFTCNICDFKIAKDSDAITQFVQATSPLHFVVRFYAYNFSSFNSFLKVSSGTDPPLA